VKKANHGLAHQRDPAVAVVATAGDDQHFVDVLDLFLPEPGVSPTFGVR
jgi:hypothetical protein